MNLWIASRAGPEGPFDPPVLVANLSTGEDESAPAFSRDGLERFFTRAPVRGQPPDLFVARRPAHDQPFGSPERLSFSTEDGELSPALALNDSLLAFTRRPADGFRIDDDLWMVTRGDGGYGTPAPLAELNSEFGDSSPRYGRTVWRSSSPRTAPAA